MGVILNLIFENISLKPVDKELLLKDKPRMDKFNTEMNKVVAISGAILFWILYISSMFFVEQIRISSANFLLAAVILTVLSVVFVHLYKTQKNPTVILYCLVFFLSVFIAVLTTFYSPNDVSGIYVGLSVLFAIIIYDTPWRVCVFTIITNVIFIAMSFCAKDFDIAILDLCNITISTTMGHLMFRYSMNTRLNTIKANDIMIEKINQEHHMQIVLSQIQPHFMFNALSTIQYLCKTDPDVAAKATNKFAKYIRTNMDSLNEDKPIPFNEELEHLENYLYIEQLRYGDRIKVKYDIKITDFKLPVLAIQPLVENAMRHGISKRDEGGTIVISTYEDDENVYVTVADNGIGFDTTIIGRNSDERSHIGIVNVRERVKLMCNGRLKVESKTGRGTKVTICLPVEE